jgi:NAD kinase
VVSVDGWVFSTPTGATPITVAADQVILRTGVTPLF